MAKSKKIDKDMGVRLKKARLDQKLTYDELSEKSGVSSRYIKEIENHGNVPSLEKLGQLIRALHISADPFFYPAAPTDNLDYQRLLVYLSECTDDQITTILALVEPLPANNCKAVVKIASFVSPIKSLLSCKRLFTFFILVNVRSLVKDFFPYKKTANIFPNKNNVNCLSFSIIPF